MLKVVEILINEKRVSFNSVLSQNRSSSSLYNRSSIRAVLSSQIKGYLIGTNKSRKIKKTIVGTVFLKRLYEQLHVLHDEIPNVLVENVRLLSDDDQMRFKNASIGFG